MAYNFKNLADVELLDTMPENAKVIVEVDGATKRAPKEDGIGKLVSVEALEEVPENATVLVEVDGEIKRVPGSGLGGGKALIIKSASFDTAPRSVAAVDLPDDFSANMTFDEMMEAFSACKLIGGFVYRNAELPMRCPIVVMGYDPINYVTPCVCITAMNFNGPIELYWTADGLSIYEPESTAGDS